MSCGCRAKDGILIDISGQRFGRWIALDYDRIVQKWRCICDCGNERHVIADNLHGGITRSCGCSTRSLPGTRYGHWTLLKFLGHDTWEAQCDCGTRDTKRESCLRIGRKDTSCGCAQHQQSLSSVLAHESQGKRRHSPLLKDLSGRRSGKLTIKEYLGSSKWLCQCDCGNVKPMSSHGLLAGKTQSCGCEAAAKTILRNKQGRNRPQPVDLTGKQFGRLVVLVRSERRGFWNCRCECGKETCTRHHSLVRSVTRSCGCLSLDRIKSRKVYATRAECERAQSDKKRMRRQLDPAYAERTREIGRISRRKGYLTPEGKARSAQKFAERRSKCDPLLISAIQWLRLQEAWDNCCAYCGQPGKLTQDHVKPIASGGVHSIDNIVPACMRCNCRKSDFELEKALRRLGCVNFHQRREAAILLFKDMNNA